MSVASAAVTVRRCARIGAEDFLAILRSGSARERAGLLLPLILPVLLHRPAGDRDDTFGLMTSAVLPTLALAWGVVWARASSARLRVLRAAFPEAPRTARALVALEVISCAALGFSFAAAVVAARVGAPHADTLAVARVAFATSFAFAGIGAALASRASAFTFAIPLLLATARGERGALYALVPNTHAFALTVDPPLGLEARARFAALLTFGLLGAIAFALSPPPRPPSLHA